LLTTEVARRRHDSARTNRAYWRAWRVLRDLRRATKPVLEFEGVELEALVQEARTATDADRLALVVEHIEFRMGGFVQRGRAGFKKDVSDVKLKPARQRGNRVVRLKRTAKYTARDEKWVRGYKGSTSTK